MGCCGSKVDAHATLKRSPFGAVLSELEAEQFASLFDLLVIKKQSTLYRISDKSEFMYVIHQGVVVVHTVLNGQQSTCTKRVGDSFGEESLHGTTKAPRMARVETFGTHPVKLLTMSQNKFATFLNDPRTHPDTKKKLLGLVGTQMKESLRKVPFLSHVDDESLSVMSSLFQYEMMDKDEVVFEEGSTGDKMYIIVKGSVAVWGSDSETGSRVKLSQNDIKAGGYFGEIALMMQVPRTAEIKTTSDCVFLSVQKKPFRDVLGMFPDLEAQFNEVCTLRITQLFQKYSIPFFKAIPVERFHELGACCELKELKEGQILFKEGDPGTEFFLMVHGLMQVLKEIGSSPKGSMAGSVRMKEVAVIKPGQYFGEVSLVTERPRGATLKATSRTILLSISAEDFNSFFEGDLNAAADFAIKLSRESVSLKNILWHNVGITYFQKHIASEYSSENLNFWLAVNKFNQLEVQDKTQELFTQAIALKNQFLGVEAPEQVNVPAELLNLVLENLTPGKVTKKIFNECREEILALMSSDSFKRFKTTELFQALLDEVGSYRDISDEEAERGGKIKEEMVRTNSSVDRLISGNSLNHCDSDIKKDGWGKRATKALGRARKSLIGELDASKDELGEDYVDISIGEGGEMEMTQV